MADQEKPKRVVINERTLIPIGVVFGVMGALLVGTAFITKLEARVDSAERNAQSAAGEVNGRLDQQTAAIIKLQESMNDVKQGMARLEGKLEHRQR